MKSGVIFSKKRGETLAQCLLRFREEYPQYRNEKITYAGRLDPLADGLLLLFIGKATRNKDRYLNLPKSYEYQILFGVETDSYDLLGIPKYADKERKIKKEEVTAGMQKYIGKFSQKYPVYSSKPVMGKPLWKHAKDNTENTIDIPSHPVTIFSNTCLEMRMINTNRLREYIETIQSIEGDFRQKEVIKAWEEILQKNKPWQVAKCKVECSGGMYVRQLVCDMGKELDVPSCALSITRTKIGDMEKG